jgi:shikimate kinase
VLATGGGAVLREENRELLRERGLVIYLQASVDEIARRTANDRTRPLLQAADPRARIVEILHQRDPLYLQTAHLTFASPAANPRRLVNRILDDPRVQERLRAA